MKFFKGKIAGIADDFATNFKPEDGGTQEKTCSDDEEDVKAEGKTIYWELKPIMVFSRVFGFAPFYLVADRAKSSVFFAGQNVLLVLLISYNMYVAGDATEGHTSRSSLSLFFFKVIALCRNGYAMLVLLLFMVRSKTCIEVWTLMEEINVILRGIRGIVINFENNRMWNYAMTGLFLTVFAGFFVGYVATMSEPLSLSFCILFFLPLFNNYLLVFNFSMLTTNLKKKLRLINGMIREEIENYSSRHEGQKNYTFLDARRQTLALVHKIRALKKVHLNMYHVVNKLNTLFGGHFIYIFAMYFALGSLHSFTIIRHISSDSSSQALFFESVLTLTIESLCITYAVYGAIIPNRELRRTIILVHKFLTMINQGDVNLENELQSFCMQLQQCGMDFTAWYLFSIDFTMLFQFIVAFFSNAVFFLQVDNMNNSRN